MHQHTVRRGVGEPSGQCSLVPAGRRRPPPVCGLRVRAASSRARVESPHFASTASPHVAVSPSSRPPPAGRWPPALAGLVGAASLAALHSLLRQRRREPHLPQEPGVEARSGIAVLLRRVRAALRPEPGTLVRASAATASEAESSYLARVRRGLAMLRVPLPASSRSPPPREGASPPDENQ